MCIKALKAWKAKNNKVNFNLMKFSIEGLLFKTSNKLTISVSFGGITSRRLVTISGWACTSWQKFAKRFSMRSYATWMEEMVRVNSSSEHVSSCNSRAAVTIAWLISCWVTKNNEDIIGLPIIFYLLGWFYVGNLAPSDSSRTFIQIVTDFR